MSGVIGSAVFNITLVIAVCALAAETVLYLNWYSVVRDCTCYLICIIVLLFTIANGLVSWYEFLRFYSCVWNNRTCTLIYFEGLFHPVRFETNVKSDK